MNGIKSDGQIEIMPKPSVSQDTDCVAKWSNRLVSIFNKVHTCERANFSPGNYSGDNYIPLSMMKYDQDELCSRRPRPVEAEAELRVDIKHLPSAFKGYSESHQQNASNVQLALWVNGYMTLPKWESTPALKPLQHKKNPLMSALREAKEDLLPVERGDHLAGRDLSLFDEKGYTQLTRAAYFNHPDCVRQLIKFGADINRRDASGSTPLITAIKKNCTEIVRILLEARADIDKVDRDSWSPLLVASRFGRTECVSMLIRGGANLHNTNSHVWSPLLSACKERHYDVVRLLVEAGVNLNTVNNGHWSPLLSLCRQKAFDIARFLVEAGADIDQKNKGGWSPLMAVIDMEEDGFAKYLIKKGARVNSRHRNNPFRLAAEHGSESLLRLLFNVHWEGVIVYLANRDARSLRLLDLIKHDVGEDFFHFVDTGEFFSLKNMCRRVIQRHIKNDAFEKLPLPNLLRCYCRLVPVLVSNEAEWEIINEDSEAMLKEWKTINGDHDTWLEDWRTIIVGVDEFFSLKNMCRLVIQRHIKNEAFENLPLPELLRDYCTLVPVIVRNEVEWEESDWEEEYSVTVQPPPI
ncbi:ankyrin repeat domain-containing protein [Endozoicomonas sp.]|uniref:ankyrin repeat domain-containing protein n=1 Tax=Endozoicomonas sp. TaxID=1892382 RepID=UPI002886948E|nr:ankyrin repeat domain-containing protein [Endozoicomonas sp.]